MRRKRPRMEVWEAGNWTGRHRIGERAKVMVATGLRFGGISPGVTADAPDFSRPCGMMEWKSSRHWIFQSRVRQGTEVHGTGKFREPAGWKACATRFGDFPGQCQ